VHTLTADMVLPEGHLLHVDEPPPKRSTERRPVVNAQDDPHARARPGGLNLPVPVLIGGALGVALLSILSSWAALSMFRGREAAVAVASPPNPNAAQVAAAPAPAPAVAGTTTAALKAGSLPQPPATQVAAAPAPAPAAGATTPPALEAAAPAEVSVVDLIQTPDDTAKEQEQERPGESDVAAQARAGAAVVASRDDGAGKSLSTADIVAESEPSVALIKGKTSSGTGFLVAPGLVATNAHVIDDEFIPDLEVRFVSADEKHNAPLKAELLYDDPERDLAFLAVKTDLKPLRVAGTYAFRKGEDITVIGNPGFGDGQVLENAISRGVMSTKTQIEGRNFYQLGIAINPGNSGGPVFDSSGRVIGVATLKASKQEATGFSIPIEDLQAALAKLAKDSTGDADRYRSRHRIVTAVKGLGSGGALMCLMIDLRRAEALSKSDAVKELLGKLEPVATELENEMFPSLATQASRIKNDALIAPPVKRMVADMAENFERIRTAYSSRKNVDDTQLRPWKQAHKRLITNLSASLKLEVPEPMMVAFDDHIPTQPTIVMMNPQNLGSYGSRLRQRSLGGPRPPGGITRPPSLRDRMGRRSGIR
jgi:S1-C subfamily serine protease